MKGVKIFPLLFISILLILIASFVLLFTWGYYKFYNKSQVEKPKTQFVSKEQIDGNDHYRDSLQQLYTSTFNNLNTSFNTVRNDSLHFDPKLNAAGLYKLRNEIETILKSHPLKADLDIARQKILELQNKLTVLNNKNLNVEDENKRLNGKVLQLTNEIKGVEQNIKTYKSENNIAPKNSGPASLSIFQLHVSAIMINEGSEQETTEAENTEKFVGSFTIKNNLNQSNDAEIIVVVLQPDGKVLQGSSWESGTFNTHEGRKIYSAKLHFEYSTGTSKRLLFSLSSDQFQKGEYTILIYYNEVIIGKGFKTLY